MPRVVEAPSVETIIAPLLAVVDNYSEVPKPSIVVTQTLHGKKPRKVVYEEISVNGVIIPRSNLKITAAMGKDMLGMETEAEYQARMLSVGKITDREQGRFRDPAMEPTHKNWTALEKAPEWHFRGPDGSPTICWRNINNRPLDDTWMSQLAQDILNRVFLLNCENIIIGKTRLVISGQHRLLALTWAVWLWTQAMAKKPSERSRDEIRWLEAWREEPYIESLVARGAEESQEVLMSIDNTKARTDADNFYTSDLIDWTARASHRAVCSKMLQDAVKLLWTRTGAGGAVAQYKTKQTAMAFAKSHPTLLRCVQHIWSENSGKGGRPISDLGLSAGQSSAMLYLMGCGDSNGDLYRSQPERTENGLNWSWLDKAKEFWSLLAASDPDVTGPMANTVAQRVMKPVRQALANIVDPDQGGGGTHAERQGIIAKAWKIFREDCEILKASIDLKYDINKEPDTGRVISRKLLECPLFGSANDVDRGEAVSEPKAKTVDSSVTKEIIEREKKAARKKEDERLEEKLKAIVNNQKTGGIEKKKALLAKLKKEQPGKIFLFDTGVGSYTVYDTDAMLVAKTVNIQLIGDDLVAATISKETAAESLKKIAAAHSNAVVVKRLTTPVGKEPVFTFSPIT